MRKVAMMSTAALLMASVAACGEHVTKSEKSVQEKTTYSSTVQDNRGYPGEQRHDSTMMEQKQQTTTSDDIGADTTTHEKVTVEKNRSETSSPASEEGSLGSTREYHQQSETFHQHIRTEVEK